MENMIFRQNFYFEKNDRSFDSTQNIFVWMSHYASIIDFKNSNFLKHHFFEKMNVLCFFVTYHSEFFRSVFYEYDNNPYKFLAINNEENSSYGGIKLNVTPCSHKV